LIINGTHTHSTLLVMRYKSYTKNTITTSTLLHVQSQHQLYLVSTTDNEKVVFRNISRSCGAEFEFRSYDRFRLKCHTPQKIIFPLSVATGRKKAISPRLVLVFRPTLVVKIKKWDVSDPVATESGNIIFGGYDISSGNGHTIKSRSKQRKGGL